MQERHSNHNQYFDELSDSCKEYFLPYIEKYSKINNRRVLEIGCGMGGNLFPFYERNCDIVGVDIDKGKIAFANQKFQQFGKRDNHFMFSSESILDIELNDKFDIIIIHDVIEHIGKKNELFQKIKSLLAEDGIVYFGFPAWQMPFGGHQQICQSSVLSKLPFIHLLPTPLYKSVLKAFKEQEHTIDELIDIKYCRVPIEKFERLVKDNGFKTVNRCLWFINPHYKVKFNLTPVKLNGFFSSIRYVRNFYTSSCFYLIKK